MFGKQPSLSTLQIRKNLLEAEAEVQREQLGRNLDILVNGVRNLGAQAKSVGSAASVVALAIAAVSAFRRARSPSRNGKVSLFSKLMAGARVASTALHALRSPNRHALRR